VFNQSAVTIAASRRIFLPPNNIFQYRIPSTSFSPPVATWLPRFWQPRNADLYIRVMTKITKRVVDQLSPDRQDVLLWDAEVKGFGVRCRPSGAKSYVLKMRVGGRQRWLTIGRHGSPWTADGARREALRLLGLKAAGSDPATALDRQKGAVTIAELADRFLREHVARHCKPRTKDEYQRAVELYIKPGPDTIAVSRRGSL
jgi:Arm DNA-binding domain